VRLPGPDYPAPAKVNLFLHVLGRRPDGYHLLQSLFTLIDRADTLRFRVRDDGSIARVNGVPGVAADDDLAVRAAVALKEATGTRLGADIELEKHIPMGAGLGGGSSDAATTLLALDRLWGLSLGPAELARIGAKLGADVPFFLFGRSAWVEGIGDRLAAMPVAPSWYVVLVPPMAVPTQEIFAAPELTRNTEALKMEDFSARPREASGWLGDARLRNDLEAVAVSRYPIVARHLAWLRRHGQARMTGSGSCVVAAFESRESAQQVVEALPEGMNGFIARGLERHPLAKEVGSK
jgi:4-diphosphocytidyl-2-C-methyl-D-erythritol kinase